MAKENSKSFPLDPATFSDLVMHTLVLKKVPVKGITGLVQPKLNFFLFLLLLC